LHQEVWEKVVWTRIEHNGNPKTQSKESYNASSNSVNGLGALGDIIAVLANFFSKPWSEIDSNLNDYAKNAIFNRLGIVLLFYGRLQESLQPLEISLASALHKNQALGSAVIAANSISNVYLSLGMIDKALKNALYTIALAERSNIWQSNVLAYACCAHTYHQRGDIYNAENFFKQAETIQIACQGVPYLYSLQGYYYNDLLIFLRKAKLVKRHASKALKYGDNFYSLLSFGLEYLSLAKAWLIDGEIRQANLWLAKAVETLRKSQNYYFIVESLLISCRFDYLTKNYFKTHRILQEVYEIAKPSGMRLHLTDYHLEMARLLIAEGKAPTSEVKEHVDQAEKLINDTGYHRRDKELADLKDNLKTLL
jgi:tetratricopeptide (TPR) repeat protein